MLININDLLDDPLSLDFVVSEDELLVLALGSAGGKKDLGYTFLSPVSVHLELTRMESDLMIVGSLKAALGLECAKCTKDFSFDISSDFSYYSPLKAKESDEEQSLDEALEAKSAHIEGENLNATSLVLEQLSLEVPIRPLCMEDCKGLCLTCGADLNEKKCGCSQEYKVDPRLAALKEFRPKK